VLNYRHFYGREFAWHTLNGRLGYMGNLRHTRGVPENLRNKNARLNLTEN
jgi:spore maturation protein CgeB